MALVINRKWQILTLYSKILLENSCWLYNLTRKPEILRKLNMYKLWNHFFILLSRLLRSYFYFNWFGFRRLRIVHEDSNYLVVDKPSSWPVHSCGTFRQIYWFLHVQVFNKILLINECFYESIFLLCYLTFLMEILVLFMCSHILKCMIFDLSVLT